MVTPRGYAQKYDSMTGDPRSSERAGRSLSLGLEGWQAALREQLGHLQGGSLAALARDSGVPLGELLQAIGPARAREDGGVTDRQDDGVAGLVAAPVRVGAERELLQAIPAWGPVRLEIQSPAGLAAEWRLDRLAFSRDADRGEGGRDGWLTLATPGSRLRIDPARIARAWFLREGEQRREVHFLDAAEEAILTLALDAGERGLDPQAEEAFFQAWRTLTVAAT